MKQVDLGLLDSMVFTQVLRPLFRLKFWNRLNRQGKNPAIDAYQGTIWRIRPQKWGEDPRFAARSLGCDTSPQLMLFDTVCPAEWQRGGSYWGLWAEKNTPYLSFNILKRLDDFEPLKCIGFTRMMVESTIMAGQKVITHPKITARPWGCKDSQRTSRQAKMKMTTTITMTMMMLIMTMMMMMMMIFLIFCWNPTRNPNDCMVNCSMGPRDFDILLKPWKKPNDCMINCSMGPRDFDILLKPWKKPNDCMINCSMGPGDFDIFLEPKKKPWWLYG